MKRILHFAALTAAVALAFAIPVAVTPQTASAAAADWTTTGEVTKTDRFNYGSSEVPLYGTKFSGTGEYRLNSAKKAWADKFGAAVRFSQKVEESIVVAISSEQDKNYEEAEGSFSLVLTPGDTATTVSVYAGTEMIEEFESGVFYWDDDNSYSTNNIRLAKGKEGWVIDINDTKTDLSAEASASCDAELEAFEDKIGYLQLHNTAGQTDLVFVSVLYGMRAGYADRSPRFAKGPLLDEPEWLMTSGDEIAAFTASNGSDYTVQGSDPIPFSDFEYTLRASHGDEGMQIVFAFTSLYQHDWYAGTYTVALIIRWDAGGSDDTATINFLRYTNTTDSSHEEPVKFTQSNAPFRWFKSNTFRIVRERGDLKLYLNGEELFAGMRDASTGSTASDYLAEIAPHYENGVGKVQFWYNSKHASDTFVIEKINVAETNSAPVADKSYGAEITSAKYKVGETVRIDLTKLFRDADGDTLNYFATKGKIENGVWEYTATMSESIFVTISGSDRYESSSIRLNLDFVNETAQAGGCSAGIAGGAAVIAGLAILSVLPLILRKGERK